MRVRMNRRRFGQLSAASGLLALLLDRLKNPSAVAQSPQGATPSDTPSGSSGETVAVALTINGATQKLALEPRVTLLDALREYIGLTGTKKGCNHGQCGACTVIAGGRRINACLALAVQYDGVEITTVEGLADGDTLHPMQAAFIDNDGFQCGFCTSGQLCSAVAMLEEVAAGDASTVTADIQNMSGPVALTDDEIRERMSGNLCRCGAYPGIVAAVQEVHGASA